MQLTEGITLELNEGVIELKAHVGALVKPKLAELKADIESGKIDLIKGTDIDKDIMIQFVDFVEGYLTKKIA